MTKGLKARSRSIVAFALLPLLFVACLEKETAIKRTPESICEGIGYEYGFNKFIDDGYEPLDFGAQGKAYLDAMKALLGPEPNPNMRAFSYDQGRLLVSKHMPSFIGRCVQILAKMPEHACKGDESDSREANFRHALDIMVYMAKGRHARVDLTNLNGDEMQRLAAKFTADPCAKH